MSARIVFVSKHRGSHVKPEAKILLTLFNSSHACVDSVCEQAQLTEVSTKQQIGVYRRSPEGLSTVVNLAVSDINSTRRLEERGKNQTNNNK